ncbi:hypothetical protein WCE41_02980 [Luteimonas sp. MJ246]|uniref:hypothetical protein n=1 Tax=Luteimonas sp. MJ174 TaxID=3129237 RepID=UPI0031BA7485
MPAIVIPLIAGVLALASPADGAVAVEGFGQAVAGSTLGTLRGGESTSLVIVDVDNSGNVEGNTAIGTVGGSNVVTGGAFGNAAGISTVIQNSGANVLIQNGTAVNVQFGGPVP